MGGGVLAVGDGDTLARVGGVTGPGVACLDVGNSGVNTGGSWARATGIGDAPGASRPNPNAPGVGGGNHAGEVRGRTTTCQLAPLASITWPAHQVGGSRAAHPRAAAAAGASRHRC
jgi:hypothetical protein